MASSFARRLRLSVREEDDCDNLFVRLSQATAADLYSLAEEEFRKNQPEENPKVSGDSWCLFDENSFDSFLPLCVSLGENTNIFASYNGGACESSSNQDTIEIPSVMLSAVTNDLPEYVSVRALSRIDYGMRVLVEPATVNDWELLEIYSTFVEDGGLLSQISVVYPNQNLTIKIGELDKVNIRVKEIKARVSWNQEIAALSVWPTTSSDDIDLSSFSPERYSPPQCVLLIEDTEMVVEPKTRPKEKVISWSDPLRLIPSDAEWGSSYKTLSSITGRDSFHVEPGCVIVEPGQWPFESEWAQIRSEDSNELKVVRVTTSNQIPRNNAGTRLDLQIPIHQGCIYLRPLESTQEERIESVILEEVHFEHDRRSLATWNVPNIELDSVSKCYCKFDQTFYPIGAVIPMPSTFDSEKGAHCLYRWFRITSNEEPYVDTGNIVRLDVKNILTLFKEALRKCKVSPDSLVVPESSTIQRPLNIVLPSDWTKPILDRMKYFGSMVLSLRGVNGSGKTFSALLLSTLASFSFHRPMFYLDCKILQKEKPRMSEILDEIDLLFERAVEVPNSIIVLDDLDSISPNLTGDNEYETSERTHNLNPSAVNQSKLIGDRLSHLLKAAEFRGAKSEDGNILLIITCLSKESISHLSLNSLQAPLIHIKVPLLSLQDRSDLLIEMLSRHNPMRRFDLDGVDISRRTEGFLPRDFEKLSARALRSHQTNSSTTSLQDSLVAELADFTPMSQMSNRQDEAQFHTSWADVGGLFHVKDVLESVVRHPLLYRRIYARARMKLPRGILLYGPSGCGKSFLVPALARECNYPLITCKGPEVLDKYIGASEAKVRELFERASQMAPSILFLDELEALAPRRGSDSTGVTDRVVNQLLTFLDGVEDASSDTVFIIGATSRPDKVDPAIIRPGRLEQHLYIGPPQTENEWSDLLIKTAKNWKLNADSFHSLSVGKEIVSTVMDISRLCPADVRAAFDTAHLNAVHRKLNGVVLGRDIKEIELDRDDIEFGLRETSPSLCESEARVLNSIYDSFRGNRSQPDEYADPKVATHEMKTSLR